MGPVKKLDVAVEEVYEIEHGLAVLPKMMIMICFADYLVVKLKGRRESEAGCIFA